MKYNDIISKYTKYAELYSEGTRKSGKIIGNALISIKLRIEMFDKS